MSEEIIEEVEPEPIPPIPCGFCGQTGQVLKGWDEDGNDIIEVCPECDGDGYLN